MNTGEVFRAAMTGLDFIEAMDCPPWCRFDLGRVDGRSFAVRAGMEVGEIYYQAVHFVGLNELNCSRVPIAVRRRSLAEELTAKLKAGYRKATGNPFIPPESSR